MPHSGSRGGPCTLHLLSRCLHCPGLDAILLPKWTQAWPTSPPDPIRAPAPTLVPSFFWGPRPRYPPGPGPSLGCPGASQTKPSMESTSPSRQTRSLDPSHPSPSGRPQLPLDSSCPLPTSSPAEATELHPMARTLPNLLRGLWLPSGSSPGTEAIFQKRHPRAPSEPSTCLPTHCWPFPC